MKGEKGDNFLASRSASRRSANEKMKYHDIVCHQNFIKYIKMESRQTKILRPFPVFNLSSRAHNFFYTHAHPEKKRQLPQQQQ